MCLHIISRVWFHVDVVYAVKQAALNVRSVIIPVRYTVNSISWQIRIFFKSDCKWRRSGFQPYTFGRPPCYHYWLRKLKIVTSRFPQAHNVAKFHESRSSRKFDHFLKSWAWGRLYLRSWTCGDGSVSAVASLSLL